MTNGNKITDYVLSIDFAKRIAMMARTEKGEEVRRYFLACEKLANSQPAISQKSMLDMLSEGFAQMAKLERQQSESIAAIAHVTERQKELEAKITTIDTNFYTVSGWASLKGLKIHGEGFRTIGKAASKASREMGIMMGKAHEAKYGAVNSYHREVLEMIFSKL